MRGGAKLVHSVDSSAKSTDLTTKNVELNFPGDPRYEAFAEDAFKYLARPYVRRPVRPDYPRPTRIC